MPTSLDKPEHPHERVERDAKIPQVLFGPKGRILVGVDDAVDKKRRPSPERHTLIPIALVEGVGRGIEPPALEIEFKK